MGKCIGRGRQSSIAEVIFSKSSDGSGPENVVCVHGLTVKSKASVVS